MAAKEQTVCTGVSWVDVIDPTPQEMQELSGKYRLNEHLVRDCMQPEHLPKYEFVDDVHFLILRYYSHTPDKRLATIQDLTNKIAIFYTDSFLITIHKYAAPFLDIIRLRHVAPGKCYHVQDVLTRIIWNALEAFDDPANRLSEQVDFYEDQVLMKKTSGDFTEALYYIKREASIAHKILMMMQEPINHIRPTPGVEAAVQDMRDQHLKIQTLYAQLLDDVNNLVNLSFSLSAQRTNEIMKVLTIFSVFFLPLTFIAGIYGMNFKHMPELTRQWGYPAVWALMIMITFFIYLWMKRKKWM